MPKTIGIVAVTAEGAVLCYRTIVAESARFLPPEQHPPIVLLNAPLPFVDTTRLLACKALERAIGVEGSGSARQAMG